MKTHIQPKLTLSIVLLLLLLSACQKNTSTPTQNKTLKSQESSTLSTSNSVGEDDEWLVPLLSDYLNSDSLTTGMRLSSSKGTAPSEVTFDELIFSREGYINGKFVVKASMDTGDGQIYEANGYHPWRYQHTYYSTGTFTPILTITYEDGQSQQFTSRPKTITVENIPPIIEELILLPPQIPQGVAPLNVDFADLIVDSKHNLGDMNMTIDFGDGSPIYSGPTSRLMHTYTEPGDYSGSITVTDPLGDTSPPFPFTVSVLPDTAMSNLVPVIQNFSVEMRYILTSSRVFFANFEIFDDKEITSVSLIVGDLSSMSSDYDSWQSTKRTMTYDYEPGRNLSFKISPNRVSESPGGYGSYGPNPRSEPPIPYKIIAYDAEGAQGIHVGYLDLHCTYSSRFVSCDPLVYE